MRTNLTCRHLLKPVGIDGNLSSPTFPPWLVFLFSWLSQTHWNPPQIGVVLLCYHPLQLFFIHRWWGGHLECIGNTTKITEKAEHLWELADVDKKLDAFVIFSLDTETRFGNNSQTWIFWGWKQRIQLLHLTTIIRIYCLDGVDCDERMNMWLPPALKAWNTCLKVCPMSTEKNEIWEW